MSEPILRTGKLTKRYGKFAAAEEVSITVGRGEIYGLVGQNGAGKTTLLKMIAGLSLPSSGTLELFGETSASGLSRARGKTGCVIETPSFFPYLSAKQNLEYYCTQRGIASPNCIAEALKFVGLSDTGNKKFRNFSLGMKQRLGLALAVMGKPDFLILDEPINGLDPMGIAEFREMILRLNREKGITILISSHILGELSQIATDYGFLHGGRLIEHSSAAELKEKCRQTLKIVVDDTHRAETVLKERLSCEHYTIPAPGEIRLTDFLSEPETVVEALVTNGVKVSEVRRAGLNLEEYFIGLVGGMHHE